MITNEEKIKKLQQKIWTKYNRKGQRPPIELVRKLSFLQGKPKKEVMKMEYPSFEGKKLPWDDEATEEDRKYWQLPYDAKTIERPNYLDRWEGIKRINEETSLGEVMANKVFINPDPNFTVRPSNRGYLWDFRKK